jgi:hypothetical protein
MTFIHDSDLTALVEERGDEMSGVEIPDYGYLIDDKPALLKVSDGPNRKWRQVRERRKICVDCKKRRALFLFRGRVRWNHDHPLCFLCFRAERDRARSTKHLIPYDTPEQNMECRLS